MKNIKAPIIAEGNCFWRCIVYMKYNIRLAANGPVTAGADEYLYNKGHLIIPGNAMILILEYFKKFLDLLLNAGGVTVSYFEYVESI